MFKNKTKVCAAKTSRNNNNNKTTHGADANKEREAKEYGRVERAVARAQVGGEQLKMKRGKNGTRRHHRLLKSWPSSSSFKYRGQPLLWPREASKNNQSDYIRRFRGNRQRGMAKEARKRNDHRLQLQKSISALLICQLFSACLCDVMSKISAASNRPATGKASRISLVICGLIPAQENPAKHGPTQRSSH